MPNGTLFYVAIPYRFAETNKTAQLRTAGFATSARDLANETGKGKQSVEPGPRFRTKKCGEIKSVAQVALG